MHPDFAHDYTQVLESVHRLRDIAADVILPGHGMPYHGSRASAVQHALERAQARS
jgi:glyoxylase-like metal-dependent hydrolase (beta-lactamase superfamily II)